MRGTFEEPPTGLIPWFSKTEGNTYATIAASPFPLHRKPTQAQDVARRISGTVAGEVFAQVKTYQVPITNSSPSHYIIFHLPLIFLSPTSPLPFYSPSLSQSYPLFPFSFAFFCLASVAAMSEIGEIIVDMDNNDNMENPEAPADEPPILHTKKFRIGSGNIIGKGVIQDFFTCAGALPSMGSPILHRTSSLVDAIAMLVVELERQFMHMHPCIQRIFLEFSNIEHSSVKRAVTIFLAHEF